MTALQQLISHHTSEKRQIEKANRIALQQAIEDELSADVLAEAEISIADGGESSTITFAGYLPVLVFFHRDTNGISHSLRYSTAVRGKMLRFGEYTLVEALCTVESAL